MPPRSITAWRRTTPSLASRWRSASVGSFAAKLRIRGEHRRNPAGLAGHADRPAQAIRAEVEFMVAEGRGVIAHHRHQPQLAADFARRGAEGRAHAVVAGVEHQHGPLRLARLPSPADQAGQPGEAAAGRVVVELERRVVGLRTHADEGRMHVVGVQDGEGLLALCRGKTARQHGRRGNRHRAGQELPTRQRFDRYRHVALFLLCTATDCRIWPVAVIGRGVRRAYFCGLPNPWFSIGLPSPSLDMTSSRLKLAAFWRCGYSLKLARYWPTYSCAGTTTKT